MDTLKIAVIGCGSRGQLFGNYIVKDERTEFFAVADTSEKALEQAKEYYGLNDSQLYRSADEFFARGKICDAVFICTQDKDHKDHAIKAMELGYDVCLEKPVAPTMSDCEEILKVQKRTGRKVMVCHELRYSHFYNKIKELIMGGAIGEVVNMSQTENVGYWHDAHSYVRGAWRNESQSSPMILAKCCHDLDIIFWLISKKCKSVSSYGSLYLFKRENAPEGSADYCCDCNEETKKKCPYDAYKIYGDVYKTYNPILGNAAEIRVGRAELLDKLLSEKPNQFGRCVYACDNDVVDHQAVNMLFEGGVTAQLTMTAFSKNYHRCLKIHGTMGEIEGDMEQNVIHVKPYLTDDYDIDLNATNADFGVHGGGDRLLFEDFVDYITVNSPSVTRTTLEDSLISHEMCFGAEKSRKNGGSAVSIAEK